MTPPPPPLHRTVTGRRRFVGMVKVGLPVTALLLIGVLFAWPRLVNQPTGFQLTFQEVTGSDDALVMKNARFRGTDSSNRPFLVTADQATQDPGEEGQVILDRLSADITLEDGTWLNLSADTGVYGQNTRLLQLYGNIAVYSDRGYEFHARSAEVDLNAGSVASDDKVWGHGPLGKIDGNGMRVYDRGARIQIINGVNTTLFPKPTEQAG